MGQVIRRNLVQTKNLPIPPFIIFPAFKCIEHKTLSAVAAPEFAFIMRTQVVKFL